MEGLETPYLVTVRYRKGKTLGNEGKVLGSGLSYSDATGERTFFIPCWARIFILTFGELRVKKRAVQPSNLTENTLYLRYKDQVYFVQEYSPSLS
jgi:hypothetical protein